MHSILNTDRRSNTLKDYLNICLYIVQDGVTHRLVNNGNKFNLTRERKLIMKLK